MSVVFVPIRPEEVDLTFNTWFPLVEKIAEHTGEHPDQLLEVIFKGEVWICIAYEPETRIAHALLGYRVKEVGENRVAEVVWLTGEDMGLWLPLMGEVEKYMRENRHCVTLKAIARPGWRKIMKEHGYAMSHVVIEKELV